jgi:glycosyltransferase involved in cell wall biosynthesis
MTKVLHIFGTMDRGGAEMRTLDVMRYSDRERFQFHFLTLTGKSGQLDDEIRALGGEVHPLPLGMTFASRLRHFLQRGRFDAVHSHVQYSSGFMLRQAQKEGVPVRIAHFHCTDDGRGHGLRRRLQRRVMCRWIDRHATNILAVSRGAMAASWKADWESDPRCRVVANGVDLAPYAAPPDRPGVCREFGLPEDETLYIHVGRMAEPKNHVRLASIFAEVVRQDPRSRLLLVGAGGNEIERQTRAVLTQKGVAGRVTFTGLRCDIARLLKAADAMIFPSLNEGLPGAVLEACAAGTPVLASRIDVIEETAANFDSVATLPLDAPDSDWAAEARRVAAAGRVNGTRRHIADVFAASGFGVERCVRINEAVWLGAGARAVDATGVAQ